MKISVRCLIFVVLISAACLNASTPTVTLYPPVDPVTKKYDEGKSCFSFKRGLLKEVTKSNRDWDLGYGFVVLNEEDWFRLHYANENRSVIKDLGELDWDKPFAIPLLEPRPPVEEGKQQQITIDTSADTHKAWAQSTQIFAKVVLSHMYVLHLKDETDDFYVLFRVEEFEQGKRCTISWRMVPAPKPAENSQEPQGTVSLFSVGMLSDSTFAVATINAWNRMCIAARIVPGSYQPTRQQPAEKSA